MRVLLCGFWGNKDTVCKIMGRYGAFYTGLGHKVDLEVRSPYKSLLCGYEDRKGAPQRQYDVIHCMSGGSFTALNYLRGGMPTPNKVIFEGGPMLGTKQEAVNFLNHVGSSFFEPVHWLAVNAVLAPAMYAHHGRWYVSEREYMVETLQALPSVLLVNGDRDKFVDKSIISLVSRMPNVQSATVPGATHNRIKHNCPQQWEELLKSYIHENIDGT